MKRIDLISSLLLAFLSTTLFAQGPVKVITPNYSFTHFEHNHLQFPGDNKAMEHFYDKLDSLFFTGQGHINILHIGDSHIQAGVLTQQVRDNLLNLYPGITAGRGLVFPFMKTNTPASFCVNRTGEWVWNRNAVAFDTRLGLAGASVTTSDPEANFSIVIREKAPRDITPVFDFNYVKILGYGDMDPVVHFNNETLVGIHDEEEGSYTFVLPDYTDSLYVDFNHAEGTFTVTGIYLDNGMPGITYHGIGVNGARVESYLKCLDLERDLRLVNPDLVIFGIGTNDAAADTFTPEKFISDYDDLIEIIHRVNPDCALLFITNNDCYKKVSKKKYAVNPNCELTEQAFFELAWKHNGAVWDFFDIMGGLGSMQKWQEEGVAQNDKVHFTNSGYALIGDLLFNALMDNYMEHLRHKN